MNTQNIDWDHLCKQLDQLWDGPLENFRYGKFSINDCELVKTVLSAIDVSGAEYFERTFVTKL